MQDTYSRCVLLFDPDVRTRILRAVLFNRVSSLVRHYGASFTLNVVLGLGS